MKYLFQFCSNYIIIRKPEIQYHPTQKVGF